MFLSYCDLHPALHRTLIDIMYAWERPWMIWARFYFSGIPAMSRLHVCVDLSFDLSGILMEIGLLDGCKLISGFYGRTKCPVSTASDMDSCLFIFIIDVVYDVSICLLVQLLMIIVLLSL